VVLFAALHLGESLSPLHAVGAALVLFAVVLGTTGEKRADVAKIELWPGLLFGASSMVLMAASIVWVKPVLARQGVVWAVTVRMVGGVLLQLVPLIFVASLRREVAVAFSRHAGLRFALPGAILGTYVSLILWIAGFKYTSASVAGILNQTSALFVVVLAAIFLHEHLTPRRALAVGLALSGCLLVLL
jgi:drug/metabolite transporter (DMT)-like permease